MTEIKIKLICQPGDYYFCSLCGKWHTDARKDHLQYRLHIKRDPNMITAPIVQPPHAPPSSNSHHSPTAVIGSFDGAAGLWKTENELLNSIPSITARRQCENILALVKGLKIAEIKLGSGGFVLTLTGHAN